MTDGLVELTSCCITSLKYADSFSFNARVKSFSRDGRRAHVGIPTMSFKLPRWSWRPRCWMAIPEAWPDPNPTTMPLFTYVSTYKTIVHFYKTHSSTNKLDNREGSKSGIYNIRKTWFLSKKNTVFISIC